MHRWGLSGAHFNHKGEEKRGEGRMQISRKRDKPWQAKEAARNPPASIGKEVGG